MAVLKLKNNYEVALVKLIKELAEHDGIPDHFEVSGKEAWEILNEYRSVSATKFVIKPSAEYDPKFILKASTDKLEMEIAQDLITRWFNGEFEVILQYDAKTEVPLKVVVQPKTKAKIEKENPKEELD